MLRIVIKNYKDHFLGLLLKTTLHQILLFNNLIIRYYVITLLLSYVFIIKYTEEEEKL